MHRPPHRYSALLGDEGFFGADRTRSYGQQFSQIYFARLAQLRPAVQAALARDERVLPVLEVVNGQHCTVIGTLYYDLPLKPSILRDVAGKLGVGPMQARTSYLGSPGEVYVEDESGRIRVLGACLVNLVTGLVVGLRGQIDDGMFRAEEAVLPGLSPQAELSPVMADAEPRYVAFVSGLALGGPSSDLAAERLLDYLTRKNPRVVRLICVGNNMARPARIDDSQQRKRFGQEQARYDLAPLRRMTSWLSQAAFSMAVDIVPGPDDPTGGALPQPPIQPALFGDLKDWPSIHFAGNPHGFTLDSLQVLCLSGQTIGDIAKYFDADSRLQMAALTLEARHIAPTAPDTVWCYPFYERDPFVLNNTPHVYVIGNQPSFESTTVTGPNASATIIVLPSFAETGTFALLNLNDRTDVRRLTFAVK